jgi:hypothetical protein
VEFFEIYLTITVHIKHSHHFVNLLISYVFAKCIKDEADFLHTDVPITVHIKCEEGLFDLIISERLHIEHSLNYTVAFLAVSCHTCGIHDTNITACCIFFVLIFALVLLELVV